MRKLMLVSVAAGTVMTLAWTAVGGANGSDRPVPEDRQTMLMERFGDEGIDANGDGKLTCGEVRSFFENKQPPRGTESMMGHGGPAEGFMPPPPFGASPFEGMGPPGFPGMSSHAGGPMHHRPDPFEMLEKLAAETAPADFDFLRFPEADSDGDGQVSNSEWTAFATHERERILARMLLHSPEADTDGNGELSIEELEALKAEREAKRREMILKRNPEADTDEDGVLSDTEFQALRAKWAEEYRAKSLERHPEADTDGNGALSNPELAAFKAKRMEEFRAKMLEPHPEADTDGDGLLSQAEMDALHMKRMEEQKTVIIESHPEADADGDGSLSPEEMLAFMQTQFGSGWAGPGDKCQGRSGPATPKMRGPMRGRH